MKDSRKDKFIKKSQNQQYTERPLIKESNNSKKTRHNFL